MSMSYDVIVYFFLSLSKNRKKTFVYFSQLASTSFVYIYNISTEYSCVECADVLKGFKDLSLKTSPYIDHV